MTRRRRRAELRSEMRTVIAALDRRWMEAASKEISERLALLAGSLVGREIEHILAWAPFFPGEVDLRHFIGEELNRRRIYLPRVLPDFKMSFLEVKEGWLASAVSGIQGIPEPTDGGEYDPVHAESTLIIVPGLAFDNEGNRLGRGKGYYDRFLARPAIRAALKVGVCWSLQVVPEIPAESHDVGMDWICHEREVRRTSAEFDDDLGE